MPDLGTSPTVTQSGLLTYSGPQPRHTPQAQPPGSSSSSVGGRRRAHRASSSSAESVPFQAESLIFNATQSATRIRLPLVGHSVRSSGLVLPQIFSRNVAFGMAWLPRQRARCIELFF